LATVHHGLPRGNCPFHPGPGRYLAFLGRISPEKRPDRAIEIAIRAGVPLKIAAKVDKADQNYFDTTIEPMLHNPLIEFIGEIDEDQKRAFLGEAIGLLFPIDWPEPFGIVMIEAMSAGTPILAWCAGSVPEVVTDGASGILVNSMDEAVAAVPKLGAMSRHLVRRQFERSFTAERMAADYVTAYNDLLARGHTRRLTLVAAG
jgi:glycosyltransferase involved in cell wall biosynthesis